MKYPLTRSGCDQSSQLAKNCIERQGLAPAYYPQLGWIQSARATLDFDKSLRVEEYRLQQGQVQRPQPAATYHYVRKYLRRLGWE